MSDYIKREDLIDKIEITPFEDYGDYLKVAEVIKNIPSADVVPKDFHNKTCEAMAQRHAEEIQRLMPKRGEWIDAEIRHEDGVLPIQVCSECKAFYPLEYTGGGHRFCPNCGADMKGADDE